MGAPGSFIFTKAFEWLAEGRDIAIATVLQTWGSAPQPVGSQLLIDADGNFVEQFQTTGFNARIWELYLFGCEDVQIEYEQRV